MAGGVSEFDPAVLGSHSEVHTAAPASGRDQEVTATLHPSTG